MASPLSYMFEKTRNLVYSFDLSSIFECGILYK